MLGIPSKAGKVPVTRFSQGTVEYVAGVESGNPTLVINANTPGGLLPETARWLDGRVSHEFKGEGALTIEYRSCQASAHHGGQSCQGWERAPFARRDPRPTLRTSRRSQRPRLVLADT